MVVPNNWSWSALCKKAWGKNLGNADLHPITAKQLKLENIKQANVPICSSCLFPYRQATYLHHKTQKCKVLTEMRILEEKKMFPIMARKKIQHVFIGECAKGLALWEDQVHVEEALFIREPFATTINVLRHRIKNKPLTYAALEIIKENETLIDLVRLTKHDDLSLAVFVDDLVYSSLTEAQKDLMLQYIGKK